MNASSGSPRSVSTPHPPAALEGFADTLMRRRSELLAMLDTSMQQEVRDTRDQADVSDFKDLAVHEMESAAEETAIVRGAAELRAVDAALARLRNGTYGLCLDCGEPIPRERLLLLPSAAYCASCQIAHEVAS